MAEENTNTNEQEGGNVTEEDINLLSNLDFDDDTDDDDDGGENEGGEEKEGADTGKGASASDKDDKSEEEGAGDEVPDWLKDIENEHARSLASGLESRDALVARIADIQTALGLDPATDWRQSITDEKLREHANRFNSPADAVKANLDLRQEISRAIIPPGKNATKEERQAFSEKLDKMLGVPKDPSEYEFPAPPEGMELSEAEKAANDKWAKTFHKLHIPKAQADELLKEFARDVQAGREEEARLDKEFAESTEAELEKEWGEDAQANRRLAQNTARTLFGDDFEDVMQVTMANGRLLMDSPFMLRVLAKLGREMSEGSADLMTDSERQTIDDQIADLRERQTKATAEGNNSLANKLFAEEQALLRRIVGNQPIVGAGDRAA